MEVVGPHVQQLFLAKPLTTLQATTMVPPWVTPRTIIISPRALATHLTTELVAAPPAPPPIDHRASCVSPIVNGHGLRRKERSSHPRSKLNIDFFSKIASSTMACQIKKETSWSMHKSCLIIYIHPVSLAERLRSNANFEYSGCDFSVRTYHNTWIYVHCILDCNKLIRPVIYWNHAESEVLIYSIKV